MNKYLSEKIKRIDEYKPAENIYSIKLDANESPYLPSDILMKHISLAVNNCAFDRYPDPSATELITAYANYISIDAADVVAGNGSDELISVICSSFLSNGDRVLVTSPDFTMYSFYSGIAEADIVTYEKESGYDIDFDRLLAIIGEKNIKMVLFSNPCNPTGVVYETDIIENFVSRADCLVVLDEAYMEFSSCPCSLLDRYRKHDNLIILKTLSKAVGLAALRVGFAIAVPELSSALRKMKSPYNVNSLTQAIATACLTFGSGEIKINTSKIISETVRMYRALSDLAEKGGYVLRKPDTNFVLLHFVDAEKAIRIFETLKLHGIIIRSMGNGILRITAGNPEETDCFLAAFKSLL